MGGWKSDVFLEYARNTTEMFACARTALARKNSADLQNTKRLHPGCHPLRRARKPVRAQNAAATRAARWSFQDALAEVNRALIDVSVAQDALLAAAAAEDQAHHDAAVAQAEADNASGSAWEGD